MAKQSSGLPLYWVEMPSNLRPKWFSDRDTAIFFAQCLYNTDRIIMNQRPIYEYWLDLQPESICKFLNEREIK